MTSQGCPSSFEGVCSGRGTCAFDSITNASYCDCLLPWANTGDFLRQPNLECSIYFPAQRGLWGLCAFVGICEVIYGAMTLRQAYSIYSKSKSLFPPFEVRALFLALFTGSLLGATGILEASATVPGSRSLGLDLTTSILFCLGTNVFWLNVGSFCINMFRMNLGLLEPVRTNPFVRQVAFVFYFIIPINGAAVIFAGILVPLMVSMDDSLFDIFARTHYVLSVLGLLLTIAGLIAIRNLIRVMKAGLGQRNNSRRTIVKVQACLIFLTAVFNEIYTMPVHLTFSSMMIYPFFTRKSSYWIPIPWTVGMLGDITLIYALKQSMDLRASLDVSQDAMIQVGSDVLLDEPRLRQAMERSTLSLSGLPSLLSMNVKSVISVHQMRSVLEPQQVG